MTQTATRLEQAAFHYRDNIVWLAYRYSGGGKPEQAYTAGWSFAGEEGTERYALLRKVLESQFGVDKQRPFTEVGGKIGFGSVFLGCSQVFLDTSRYIRLNHDEAGGFPEDLKVIFREFFHGYGIDLVEIDAPWQRFSEVNERWKEAMGEDVGEDEPGGVRALSVMSAGIRDQSAN